MVDTVYIVILSVPGELDQVIGVFYEEANARSFIAGLKEDERSFCGVLMSWIDDAPHDR
jgi:hypothetical protein